MGGFGPIHSFSPLVQSGNCHVPRFEFVDARCFPIPVAMKMCGNKQQHQSIHWKVFKNMPRRDRFLRKWFLKSNRGIWDPNYATERLRKPRGRDFNSKFHFGFRCLHRIFLTLITVLGSRLRSYCDCDLTIPSAFALFRSTFARFILFPASF